MNMKEIIAQALDSFTQDQLIDLQKAMNNIMTDELVEAMEEIEKYHQKQSPVVEFHWNTAIDQCDMQPNTIYLDGSCRGFIIDEGINSISFDHHTGCVRSITHATCVQVMNAIKMGFDPKGFGQIIIDDIDADTVMSVWLLLNPHQVENPYVVETVNAIGLVDAHFDSAFDMHPLHIVINPLWNVERTEDLFNECLAHVDNHIANPDAELPPSPERPKGLGYGFRQNGTFERVEDTNFKEMYQDFDVVMMVNPLKKGHNVTIGKKSEFVMWFDLEIALIKLAKAELNKCDELAIPLYLGPSKNWGGSSTIGGSARYDDQSQGTRLDIDFIVFIVQEVGCGHIPKING